MNQIFSPARFGAYAMRFISQKGKHCLLMYVVITCVLAVFMALGDCKDNESRGDIWKEQK